MIGETIKDFTITAQLGRGGMGEVFVAEQRLIKTKVAIKMLQPQISAEKAHVDRFFNEAIAVSKIRHAGIVKIFDVGFHVGRAYLVMELLEGETLSARLRRGLPFSQSIGIARQVTSVLDATHAAGITHRDLKPDNIFLVPDAELGERVRILDFGIAKLGDVKATAESMSMGTPAYMPPELWKDAATSGPPTDVYALGCVVFEMCAGRPPFIVTAVSDACGRHLTEIPPRLRSLRAELPAALDELIANMLEKEQAARPTTKAIAGQLAALETGGIAATLPQTAASSHTPPAVSPASARTAIGYGTDSEVAKLEAEGKWMELVKLLSGQAETGDASAKAALHLKIAMIYSDRFANLAEAIKSYERVLSHEPDHRKAIDALRALYEKRRDWEKLLELEKGELGRTAPDKRADKAVDVARLAAARVSKPDVQLYWWERVIEHEPEHRQAFAELTKLYAHAERYTDLADILRRQADLAAGNDDRAAALRKLAVVEDQCLADRDAAIATLRTVIELDPRDAEAKRALAQLRENKPVEWKTLGEAYRIPTLGSATSGSWKATEPPKQPEPITAPAAPVAPVASMLVPDPGLDSVPAGSLEPRSQRIGYGIGVLVAAGLGIFVATRDWSSDKPTADPPQVTQRDPQPKDGSQESTARMLAKHTTGPLKGALEAMDAVDSAQAKGLTLSYRVLSKPAGGGEFRVVKPGEELRTDDRLAFEVMVSEQAHVFLSQRPKGKSLAVLFPNAGIDVTNPLPPRTWTRIPSGTRSFRINDKDVGLETVYFIASRVPPPNLAAAIANEGKPGAKQHAVEEQVVAVAMEKRDDCSGRGREIVLDGEDDCKVKTRGLELDDEKDAKRVRGMTMDEVVFVPFAFKHAAKLRTPDRSPPPVTKPETAPSEPAPATPTSLSGGVFSSRMRAITSTVRACYAGTEGSARVKLTIAPTGEVTNVVVTGVGRTEAACVENAVKTAKFPPWEGGPQTFNYSYLLSE